MSAGEWYEVEMFDGGEWTGAENEPYQFALLDDADWHRGSLTIITAELEPRPEFRIVRVRADGSREVVG